MAENKKSFVLYVDQRDTFNALSDTEAGKLIKHIFAYVADENPSTDKKLLKIAFEPIKQQLKRDLKKWESGHEKRVAAGKAGGIKSGLSRKSEAMLSNASNDEANEGVNGNVNGIVNVNVIGSNPPTPDQVCDYFEANGYTRDAGLRAFNYYNEANWVDSNGKKVKRWKQKMIAVWFKPENKKPIEKNKYEITDKDKW